MNKILKLIIDDYQNHKPSTEARLTLEKFCSAQREFMNSLTPKQKKAFFSLDCLNGEIAVVEQDEFAKYLYENLKKTQPYLFRISEIFTPL